MRHKFVCQGVSARDHNTLLLELNQNKKTFARLIEFHVTEIACSRESFQEHVK